VKRLKEILKDESGQGMLEYVILLALVVAVGLAFRGKITSFFTQGTDAVTGAGADVFKTSP